VRVSRLLVFAVAVCAIARADDDHPATVGDMAFLVGDWLEHWEKFPDTDQEERWAWRGKELVGEVYAKVDGRPYNHFVTRHIRAAGKSIELVEEYPSGHRYRCRYFGIDSLRGPDFTCREGVIHYKLDGEGRLVRTTYSTHQHGALPIHTTVFSRKTTSP
jgi:hypothetical protein